MNGFDDLAAHLPPGMISTHHGELAAHAHDRWALALLRATRGDRPPPPASIVYPTATEHVATVLRWASETQTPVVVRGGGSGLAGGAEAVKRSVMIEMSHLDRVTEVDPVSQTISAQAGIRGDVLEAVLAPNGLTLGFDPVSLRISTLGGWVATAATGVATTRFGGVGDLLLGLTVVLSQGEVVSLRSAPRTAAGPDLRRLLVGSEGTFAVITEATLRASRHPSNLAWSVFVTNSFESGVALVREIVQRPFRPLVVRLHDAAEAAGSLDALELGDRPVLFVGLDEGAPGGDAERFELQSLGREFGARPGDARAAAEWWDRRFDQVERYEEIMGPGRSMGPGVVVDVVDTAALWRRIPKVYEEVRGALLDHAERVTCRLTDPTGSGAALLFTFTIRAADDREAEAAYLEAWDAAAQAALGAGATISSASGIGLLKAHHLDGELGTAGVGLLRRLKAAADPAGVLNPGKLLPPPSA